MTEDTAPEQEAPVEYDDEFDLDADYKPVPLIPKGSYKGNIVSAGINDSLGAITVDVQLQGNEAFCSDGETPVDGQTVQLRLWLPKPSDATTMTPKGQMTKKQWKINNLKDSLDKIGVQASTMTEIRQQLEEGSWMKDDVNVDVDLNTYKGETSNQANSIYI